MHKTLYPNRAKFSAFSLLCLLGVWLGWGVSWFLTLASAAGVVIFPMSLLPGAAWLKLDEQGFTIRSMYRHTSTRWADVGTILVVTQRQMGTPVNRMVGRTMRKTIRDRLC